MTLISIIFTSALVSTMVSGLTTYLIEKRKYNQEYWKITISKRLEVYEEIERILVYFQSSHFYNEKPCHLAFLEDSTFDELQSTLAQISWKRNWISPKLYGLIIQLNRELYKYDYNNTPNIMEFGVKNYQKFSNLRDEILNTISKDYSKMSNVKGFFKLKIKENKKLSSKSQLI